MTELRDIDDDKWDGFAKDQLSGDLWSEMGRIKQNRQGDTKGLTKELEPNNGQRHPKFFQFIIETVVRTDAREITS